MPVRTAVVVRRGAITARGEASRLRLVGAARDELVERGGALEIDSVAGRADASVGLIYRHFGSRAGLICAVVDDFYGRYRADVLDVDPAPGASFGERERRRTALTVAFHYGDPLAPVVLSSLHLDTEVAAREAVHIARTSALTAETMALGQRCGGIPSDRDPRLLGAMIIGGTRQVLAEALGSDPRLSQERAVHGLWVLRAAVMGLEP